MKLHQTLTSLSLLCIGIVSAQYFIYGFDSLEIMLSKCFFTFVGGIFIHWMWVDNK